MDEKRDAYTKANLDKDVEIQKRINSRNMVSPGKYTLQKRVGYVVVKSVQWTPLQQRQRLESPPVESAPKRQKLEKGSSSSQVEQYSPKCPQLELMMKFL